MRFGHIFPRKLEVRLDANCSNFCSATQVRGVIYYWQDFSLPKNWAFICQRKLHCLPFTKVYYFNHCLFILITFVNLLVSMSVNSSMLALDEKKAGVGIAAFCLMLPPETIWIPKLTPEEKLSFQLLQCHLPFECALTLSSPLFLLDSIS